MTKETIPDFREVMVEPTEFSHLVEDRLRIKAEIAELEAQLKEVDNDITSSLTEANEPRVQYGDYKVGIIESQRSTLSKERLVELGVPVSIVQQATKVTKFTFIRVDAGRE